MEIVESCFAYHISDLFNINNIVQCITYILNQGKYVRLYVTARLPTPPLVVITNCIFIEKLIEFEEIKIVSITQLEKFKTETSDMIYLDYKLDIDIIVCKTVVLPNKTEQSATDNGQKNRLSM